jgi:hypothetical protein
MIPPFKHLKMASRFEEMDTEDYPAVQEQTVAEAIFGKPTPSTPEEINLTNALSRLMSSQIEIARDALKLVGRSKDTRGSLYEVLNCTQAELRQKIQDHGTPLQELAEYQKSNIQRLRKELDGKNLEEVSIYMDQNKRDVPFIWIREGKPNISSMNVSILDPDRAITLREAGIVMWFPPIELTVTGELKHSPTRHDTLLCVEFNEYGQFVVSFLNYGIPPFKKK